MRRKPTGDTKDTGIKLTKRADRGSTPESGRHVDDTVKGEVASSVVGSADQQSHLD